MKQNRLTFEITSFSLHIIAMVLMLCDHLWATIIPGNDWMNCIGRISFPIFAFLIVEGYFHTRSLKKYVLRLLFFAILSEIPFNLMISGRVFSPLHQNVLWTFLFSIGLIYWNENARKGGNPVIRMLVAISSILVAYIVGLLTFVDYYHAGILTVLAFYFFREKKWWSCLALVLSLWWINAELLGGLVYEITIFGRTFFLHRQAFAVLSLIPILLYRGKRGYHSKAFQYACYAFYPCHLLVLLPL